MLKEGIILLQLRKKHLNYETFLHLSQEVELITDDNKKIIAAIAFRGSYRSKTSVEQMFTPLNIDAVIWDTPDGEDRIEKQYFSVLSSHVTESDPQIKNFSLSHEELVVKSPEFVGKGSWNFIWNGSAKKFKIADDQLQGMQNLRMGKGDTIIADIEVTQEFDPDQNAWLDKKIRNY